MVTRRRTETSRLTESEIDRNDLKVANFSTSERVVDVASTTNNLDDSQKRPRLKAVSMEYEALRDELLQRMEMRDKFLLFALTGVGALFSIAVQFNRTIFLLIPIMQVPLVLYWAYTDVGIAKIAYYTRTVIEPCFKNRWETTTWKERTENRHEARGADSSYRRLRWATSAFDRFSHFIIRSRRSETVANLAFNGSSAIAMVLWSSSVYDDKIWSDRLNTISSTLQVGNVDPNIYITLLGYEHKYPASYSLVEIFLFFFDIVSFAACLYMINRRYNLENELDCDKPECCEKFVERNKLISAAIDKYNTLCNIFR